jgi:signal transduction histidine kinase
MPDSVLAAGHADGPPFDELARRLGELQVAAKDPGLRHQLGELRALALETAASNAQLADLTHHLQVSTEREKCALARELHDELGGILTPAKMDMAWLESRLGADPEFRDRMGRLGKLIDQGIDLKRRVIENLRPSLLDHLGLSSALQWYVDETCTQAHIESHLHISKTLERLTPDLEIALYRLVQGAVSNVVRHAQAAHLDLTLERTPAGVHMTVSDDGVGITDLVAAMNTSHGLAAMSHRVRSANGTFKVHSLSGKGTRVEMFVPLAAVAAKVPKA